MSRSTRVSGFYRLTVEERRRVVAEQSGVPENEMSAWDQSLSLENADRLVENVVGVHSLPLGIAQNFIINGIEVPVPMVTEEPSVVAAASNAARLIRSRGGFVAESTPPVMIAQVELMDVGDVAEAKGRIEARRDEAIERVNEALPSMHKRGGGAIDIEVRVIEGHGPGERRLVVHLGIDCREAMGANVCNTAAEAIAPWLAELSGGRVGLRILSNLTDRRVTKVAAEVTFEALASGGTDGALVAQRIVEASRFAELDVHRAVTHNKGIMNGVDAVALACGQDWRALEAGAHASAVRDGRYGPLATWHVSDRQLRGTMRLPLAVGAVGGVLRAHRGALLNLRLIGSRGAAFLAQVIASAGLATNLAALRALAFEGITRGHMKLHNRA